jgi:polyhydroxyalkanoate synthesis regulator phasin
MSQIPFEKSVFNKEAFDKLVNRQFTQLAPLNVDINDQETAEPEFTVDDFLNLFNTLYTFIPEEDLRTMLEKIAGTLDVRIDNTDVDALLQEITSLRQQLVDIQQTLAQLPPQ